MPFTHEYTWVSWTTTGLSAVTLFLVTWKIWNTSENLEKRAEEETFLGRCSYEWRHFITDFSQAAFVIIALSFVVNLSFVRSRKTKVIEKEVPVVIEKEVNETIEREVAKEFWLPYPYEKIVYKEKHVPVLDEEAFRKILDAIPEKPIPSTFVTELLKGGQFDEIHPPGTAERKDQEDRLNLMVVTHLLNPKEIRVHEATAHFWVTNTPPFPDFTFRIGRENGIWTAKLGGTK